MLGHARCSSEPACRIAGTQWVRERLHEKGVRFNKYAHDKGKCERRVAANQLESSFVSLVFRRRLGLECLAGSSSPRASRCDLSLVALPWSAGRLLRVNLPGSAWRFKLQTWLILPVVICLSQRLSHACLRINLNTLNLQMAL